MNRRGNVNSKDLTPGVSLSGKLDRVEERLEKKIDAVAADLTAHRADTEGHKRGYMVKENPEP